MGATLSNQPKLPRDEPLTSEELGMLRNVETHGDLRDAIGLVRNARGLRIGEFPKDWSDGAAVVPAKLRPER